MKYLGIDVHVAATVWCLLDDRGEIVDQGKTPTTQEHLTALIAEIGGAQGLLVGQEIGTMAYFVHDVLTALSVEVRSFNAYHLRMIAASRKKTDKRDAYWIAKALQTGMTPHAVYIPTGEIRQLRRLLSRRAALANERRMWLLRAHAYLHGAGFKLKSAHRNVALLLDCAMNRPEGLDADLHEALSLCNRMEQTLLKEQKQIEELLFGQAEKIDAVRRLMTIPAVGVKVAAMVYAWIGDIKRFPDARSLASYAGLVPSVHQSGSMCVNGHITKQGAPQLRSVLVQAGHVLMWRCKNEESSPLRAIAERVHTARVRRKIAVVAAGRHLLRIAYYILRDGTTYDPARLSSKAEEVTKAA